MDEDVKKTKDNQKEQRQSGRPPRTSEALKVTVENIPAENKRGASLAELTDLKAIKVSANSTTRGLAGAMAKLAREQRRVEILAGSAACVNTAVKAIVTARRYLDEDPVDVLLVATVATRNAAGRDRRKALELAMCPYVKANTNIYAAESVEYSAGANTSTQALAGALAARFRDGKSAVVKCIGATPVLRALTACGLGAAYADAKVDIFPVFETATQKEGDGTVSVMVLNMRLVL